VVYDEVAVGMYRLGPATTAAILGEDPDIAVYGKLISGGYLPIRCRYNALKLRSK
jgi:dethiobiotin synthetase/adenosylmethionine--8-amino-7-oxononanoate aminotransferase